MKPTNILTVLLLALLAIPSKAADPVVYHPDGVPGETRKKVEPVALADEKEKFKELCAYRIAPRVIAQTPKYLGVTAEVLYYPEQVNVWDWLADSGAGLVRCFDLVDLREPVIRTERFKRIQTRADFEAWRSRLKSDPDKMIPWEEFSFDKLIPWHGIPDQVLQKMKESKLNALVPVTYQTHHYPVPLLKSKTDLVPVPDEEINWDAAASAYEYCLAQIHRYVTHFGVHHLMMYGEPSNEENSAKEMGVVAQMARLALEDVRGRLADKQLAARLFLGSPGNDIGNELYWKYLYPYVDAVDFHCYNPDPQILARKFARLEMTADSKKKKTALSEFGRIPGPTQPNHVLFGINASLEAASLMMTALSSSNPQSAGFEYAMFYQFSSPATHRSYKSLIYGDMNALDWNGTDRVTLSMASELGDLSLESMQLRFPTPAYHMFKMLTRCVPGNKVGTGGMNGFEVLATGETDRGFRPGHNAAMNQAAFAELEPKKYYAVGGDSEPVRVMAVRGGDCLYFMFLNQGPKAVQKIAVELDYLPESYATAVVRETSQLRRDEATVQLPVVNKRVMIDVPQESLVQVIFTKEDLSNVSELKLEEQSLTPGTSSQLKLLETTRFRALGKLDGKWLDLTDLNVRYTSSSPELVMAFQGGLVQRVCKTKREVAFSAQTLNGIAATPVVIPPGDLANRDAAVLANGDFEKPVSEGEPWACRYDQNIRWILQPLAADGWVASKNSSCQVSGEQNHTPNGKTSLKLQFSKVGGNFLQVQARSFKRKGLEINARKYKVVAWVYRPATGGSPTGQLDIRCEFKNFSSNTTVAKLIPVKQSIKDLPTDSWVQLQGEVEAPVNASYLDFSVNISGASEGMLYLDDVALEPVFMSR